MESLKNPKSLVVRLFILISGLIVAAFGIAVYLKTAIGSDPVTVFLEGLNKTFGISIGTATTIYMATFLLILLIFDRSKLGIGTIIHTLGFGYLCDAWIFLLDPLDLSQSHLIIKLLISLIATSALASGLGIYQAVYLGVGASDGFVQFLAKTTRIPLRYTRIIFDAVMLILGLILGGVIHIATIHATFLLGPIMAGIYHRLTCFLIEKNLLPEEYVQTAQTS
jgi:uncharacterized membrane protein YczE